MSHTKQFAVSRSSLASATVRHEEAHDLADAYLLDHVGDTLVAGAPRLSESGRWVVPIVLAYMRRGELGEVGTLELDATSGEVFFTEEDRERVMARARRLVGDTSPHPAG